jgi:hypothetical protein
MRLMVLVKADESSEKGVMPDEKLISDMSKYNEEMVKAGVMLAGEGLHPSSKGVRIRLSGGKYTVMDGPFAEAKELVAGFWLIQTKSKEEAIDWLKRAPFQGGAVEIRPLFELEDFPVDPAEQAGGWRENEQQWRDTTAAQNPTFELRGGKTMRFLCFVKADTATEAGVMPDEKSLSAMGAFIDEAIKSDVLLGGEGLQPTSKAVRVHYSGSKRTVTDGPFTESKELVAGFALLQVNSKAEVVDWGKRFLAVDVEGRLNNEAEIEIRQVFELSDFPQSEAIEHEAKLRAELTKSKVAN